MSSDEEEVAERGSLRRMRLDESDRTSPFVFTAEDSGEAKSPAQFQRELTEVESGLRLTGLSPEIEAARLSAARKLRALLHSNRELLITEVLERNWIPMLLGWLQLQECPSVQVEALWALTNVAAGTSEHGHVLIKHGAVPTLVGLLDSENDEVLEQALWLLGNLAGDGVPFRDAVLSANVLPPLVSCLALRPNVLSLLRIGSWTLSNLCDGQPRPTLELNMVMRALQQLLCGSDPEVLSHTCWALSHLCDGPSSHIKTVVEGGVCPRLVELLSHRSWRVTKPALRTIGNIVCAEDDIDYTQHIIEAGAVRCLRVLISHSNREIQKEACWTLSNIAAGTVEQIQTVLDSGVITPLISIATLSRTDGEVRSEACWVVLNATSCGSDAQIKYLVNEGCTKVLMDLLSETSMVMMALEGLERILQVGEDEGRRSGGSNPYAPLLSAQRIEELEQHKSQAIAKRAARIWRTHYVTCAICSLRFPKASDATRFCQECKCYVCGNCNCSIYHLTFQEEYWAQMEGREAKEATDKATSKRNRKQRKKQKLKERKQQAKEKKEKEEETDEVPSVPSSPDRPPASPKPGPRASALKAAKPTDERGAAQLPAAMSLASRPFAEDEVDPQMRNGRTGRKKNRRKQAPASGEEPPAAPVHSAETQNGAMPTATRRKGRGRPDSGADSGLQPLAPRGAAPPPPVPTGAESHAGARAPRPRESAAAATPVDGMATRPEGDGVPEPQTAVEGAGKVDDYRNDMLVDYLESTGSILALAKMLEQQED